MMTRAEPAQFSTHDQVRQLLAFAQPNALKLVPPVESGDNVGDWRCFFYSEYGLAVESTQFKGAQPKLPEGIAPEYKLPTCAHPKGCATCAAPRLVANAWDWAKRLARIVRGINNSDTRRDARGLEYWFGHDHRLEPGVTYLVEIRSRYNNRLYAYLAWLAPISLLLGLINFLSRLFGWF